MKTTKMLTVEFITEDNKLDQVIFNLMSYDENGDELESGDGFCSLTEPSDLAIVSKFIEFLQ